MDSFRRPLRSVSAEMLSVAPPEKQDVRRTKSAGIPAFPVACSRSQGQTKEGSRKQRNNACSIQTVLAFFIGAALMFAIMRHSPSLLGNNVGNWLVLPAKELPGIREVEAKGSGSGSWRDRHTFESREAAAGEKRVPGSQVSRRELRKGEGPADLMPAKEQHAQLEGVREAHEPATLAQQREGTAEEKGILPSQHPVTENDETSDTRKDEPLQAQMQTAESLPVEAAKQPAEHDKLMESFMSGAILEVKTFDGMVVLEDAGDSKADLTHGAGIETADLAQALQQSKDWEVRDVADAS